jgi:hypothetical protein
MLPLCCPRLHRPGRRPPSLRRSAPVPAHRPARRAGRQRRRRCCSTASRSRLAPGARIRGEDNMLELSAALAGRSCSCTTRVDNARPAAGRLDPDAAERAASPGPTTRRGAGWRFDPVAADLEPAMSGPAPRRSSSDLRLPDERVRLGQDGRRAARRRRLRADRRPEQADLILFNTCSVREKAQEKVFSDLGRVKHLKAKGVLIGVGGCVASQEGAAIIERAPYVDLVFGPQTLHRLPQMIAARRRSAGRRSTSASPRSRSSTTCRRRASRAPAPSCRSWKAAASTAATAWCPTPAARRSAARSTTC